MSCPYVAFASTSYKTDLSVRPLVPSGAVHNGLVARLRSASLSERDEALKLFGRPAAAFGSPFGARCTAAASRAEANYPQRRLGSLC